MKVDLSLLRMARYQASKFWLALTVLAITLPVSAAATTIKAAGADSTTPAGATQQSVDQICVNGRCESLTLGQQKPASASLSLCELFLPAQVCAALEDISIGEGTVSFTIGSETFQIAKNATSMSFNATNTKTSNGLTSISTFNFVATPPGYLVGLAGQSSIQVTNTTISQGATTSTKIWGTTNNDALNLTISSQLNGRTITSISETISKVQGALPAISATLAVAAQWLTSTGDALLNAIAQVVEWIIEYVLPLI